MLGQTVDRLTDQNSETGEIVPYLAESWEMGADGRSFTFHLRDGATFSDGTPVDATAVKATFDGLVALGAKAPSASQALAGYGGVTVIDDRTAEISFDQPNAQFLQATSTATFGIVSAASAAKTPEERCADGVIGSGPFVLSSYVHNDQLQLKKRDGYAWGSSARENKGEAYLDEVTFKIIPEPGVRAGALTSGTIQIAYALQDQSVPVVEAAGLKTIIKPYPGMPVSAVFNMASPLGSDPAVREAVMLAVDRADIAAVVGSAGSPAATYLSATTPGASDMGDVMKTDVKKAEEVLDSAGWKLGSDGVREKDGVRLSLRLPFFFLPAPVELLQQQLAKVGIDAQLRQLPVADYTSVLTQGDFDVTTTNWGTADASALASLASSRYGQQDPAFLELLTKQNSETDPGKRAKITEEVQRYIYEKAFAVPMFFVNTVFGVAADLNGVALDGSSRLVLSSAWLQKAK
ncbi:peptide/nickel transport system substrate-binding protein [Microbacterium resistens]|uniref:Peptide/nickel transport system substrate-binding protein n=1 Tax=Microbacterium resistens TaxID=156977 RepID=A0ABU1SFK2_9MICO|nr:ABC transporter substrate-binding protein [Microbacterium resistens]MDR6868366.1 peptide/nickel transport system substrate-binding protein [Microbacterium resistens]